MKYLRTFMRVIFIYIPFGMMMIAAWLFASCWEFMMKDEENEYYERGL